ncbi:MAG: hypothetical protein Kow00123_15690 [Anaerolineales bacterium]
MSPKRTISRGKCFLCGGTFKIVSFILNLMLSKIEGPVFNINKTPPDLLIAMGLYRSGHPDAAIRILGFFDGLCSLRSSNNLKRAVKFGPILLPTAILAASCVAKPPAEVRPATLTPTPPFTLTPTPTETPTATPSPTPEPSPTPTATPTETAIPPEERPLDLAGFNEVWNPNTNRFEYVDEDQQVIAYWDQGNKRVELVEGLNKLDLEKHKGLFVGWSVNDVSTGFQDAKKNGEIKIAFMFEPVTGQVEVIRSATKNLCFKNVPPQTVFKSPIKGHIILGRLSSGTRIVHTNSEEYDLDLSYFYPFEENYIGPKGGDINIGDRVVKATEEKLEKLSRGTLKDYQIIIALQNGAQTIGVDFTLQIFLRDSSGRIVYIKSD